MVWVVVVAWLKVVSLVVGEKPVAWPRWDFGFVAVAKVAVVEVAANFATRDCSVVVVGVKVGVIVVVRVVVLWLSAKLWSTPL